MHIVSRLFDSRINADNILLEVTAGEYLDIARGILANNEFQRRRIKSTPPLYSLLKEDLLRGCVIPPIVLAVGGDNPGAIAEGAEAEFLRQHQEHLLILDGLQRTSTMLELEDELKQKNDENSLRNLWQLKLRIELYVGINRLGILYRMLTLNTGQTPMSLRQQVEILYLDYAKAQIGQGIQLIREVDDGAIDTLGKYSFKAVIDGFNSYLERNELPIDRYDLLESVKSLEKLSKENAETNLFKDLISTYHSFVAKVVVLSKNTIYSSSDLGIQAQPFGIDARRVFVKEQAIAGFGAALGKLIDFKLISGFNDVQVSIEQLHQGDGVEAIADLLKRMEFVRHTSKKIGNSQRLFFHFFFRELFNPESDAYRNLLLASEAANKKYESQTL